VLLILPLQVVLNFVLIVPFVLAIYLSLTNWSPITGPWYTSPIVGGQNYVEILSLPRFQHAIVNTLVIVGGAVSLEFLFGLVLALAFFSWDFRGKSVFASIFLVPMMVIPAISGFTFQTIFATQGALNDVLTRLSGTVVGIDWLHVPWSALLAIILADVWQWTPFMFLLMYAGMTALPSDPIRAARVMGASERQIFRRIMLPMLKPIITIALIIRSLEAFKIFDVPFIMTQGGPGTTTETISIFLYKYAIEFARVAYASAGAIVIFVVIVIVTLRASRSLLPKAE
jgi:multiple sugar transport system permease protein